MDYKPDRYHFLPLGPSKHTYIDTSVRQLLAAWASHMLHIYKSIWSYPSVVLQDSTHSAGVDTSIGNTLSTCNRHRNPGCVWPLQYHPSPCPPPENANAINWPYGLLQGGTPISDWADFYCYESAIYSTDSFNTPPRQCRSYTVHPSLLMLSP